MNALEIPKSQCPSTQVSDVELFGEYIDPADGEQNMTAIQLLQFGVEQFTGGGRIGLDYSVSPADHDHAEMMHVDPSSSYRALNRAQYRYRPSKFYASAVAFVPSLTTVGRLVHNRAGYQKSSQGGIDGWWSLSRGVAV